MTMRVRTGLMLIVAMATLVLASCDHYTCGSGPILSGSCTASAPGLGGSGTGTATAAFVFVANGTGNPGSVLGYTLNTTNSTLSATANYTAPATPGDDVGMGMAVAQKQFLYTAFGETGQIYGWSISTTGTLSPVGTSPYLAPSLVSAASFEFDTQRVITNPAGTLLFIADAFHDEILVYQIGTGGVLTAATGSPFPVPFSPGNMTTDGLGLYLYFTNSSDAGHTGTEIAAYAIGSTCATAPSSCTLTAVTGSPFSGSFYQMWQVQGEPTGQFLIGTKGMSLSVNGADDPNLYVFSITQSGASAGAINQVVQFPTTNSDSPFSIAVQSNPGGNLVYAFGLDDLGTAFNPADGYTLSSGGALTALTGSNTGVGDMGQFDQSGGFLFAYGGVGDNGTVVYELTGFDVVSGALTTPSSTGTFGGFWVATDPQ